jgi:uncharacterized protein (TIGR02145 family)
LNLYFNTYMAMNNLLKIVFFILLSIFIFLPSCKKEEEQQLVKVTTDPVLNISRTTCSFHGSLINTGTDTVISFGFCWSTRAQPTFSDNTLKSQNMASGNSNDGTFNYGLGGLSPNTPYYVRAFAVTIKDKIYGDQETFTTKPATAKTTFNPHLTYQSITDIDGNIYKTIKIGNQEWMAENLKTTRFNDGTAIPLVTDNNIWNKLITPGYCWYNNDEEGFKNIYGAYYNWRTVKTGELCPSGWHVPTKEDWKVLKLSMGISPELAEPGAPFQKITEANKIKETGNFNWVEGSLIATNESGFTALPGGSRSVDTSFGGEGTTESWWLASDYALSIWIVNFADWILNSDMLSENSGMNVRCMKD